MIVCRKIQERCWQCEWRSHEAILSRQKDGTFAGDLIAYGEYGRLDAAQARAIAYAFGLSEAIDGDSERWLDCWFAGSRMVEKVRFVDAFHPR